MYYMILLDVTEATEVYVGLTPESVIEKARPLIARFEANLELIGGDEIFFCLLDGDFERHSVRFVQITSEWLGDLSIDQAREVYENSSVPLGSDFEHFWNDVCE